MADVSKIDRSSKMMKIAMTENENVGLMRNLTQKANWWSEIVLHT